MAKILIVDDEAVNRELLRVVLAQDAHEIHLASNGDDALELTREAQFDLVIVDLYMPGMNGTQFVRALRGEPEISQTRVALYTGTSIDAALRDFMHVMSIVHVVPKPADPEQIIVAVRDALQ